MSTNVKITSINQQFYIEVPDDTAFFGAFQLNALMRTGDQMNPPLSTNQAGLKTIAANLVLLIEDCHNGIASIDRVLACVDRDRIPDSRDVTHLADVQTHLVNLSAEASKQLTAFNAMQMEALQEKLQTWQKAKNVD